jgi:hypothetical protein
MKRNERHTIMRKTKNPPFQIVKLGKQLGLDSEQISSILSNTQQFRERPFLRLGPPHYGGAFYGAVSINEFNIRKKQDMKE